MPAQARRQGAPRPVLACRRQAVYRRPAAARRHGKDL